MAGLPRRRVWMRKTAASLYFDLICELEKPLKKGRAKVPWTNGRRALSDREIMGLVGDDLTKRAAKAAATPDSTGRRPLDVFLLHESILPHYLIAFDAANGSLEGFTETVLRFGFLAPMRAALDALATRPTSLGPVRSEMRAVTSLLNNKDFLTKVVVPLGGTAAGIFGDPFLDLSTKEFRSRVPLPHPLVVWEPVGADEPPTPQLNPEVEAKLAIFLKAASSGSIDASSDVVDHSSSMCPAAHPMPRDGELITGIEIGCEIIADALSPMARGMHRYVMDPSQC